MACCAEPFVVAVGYSKSADGSTIVTYRCSSCGATWIETV